VGTWILETDKALYLMDGDSYIDKVDKVASANGEYTVTTSKIQSWFSRSDRPERMKIVRGGSEPSHAPSHGSGLPKLPPIKFIPASDSNYNSRNGTKIDTIVVHNTDTTLQAAIAIFQNPKSQVSAHYIVARSGDIIQMVRDSFRAWHAGDRGVNARSIGIEHEATEANRGMTPTQEQSSIALIEHLIASYDIPLTNVRPHRDVTTIPGGTDCPKWIWPSDSDFDKWKSVHLA
jgi:N-acetylmuramoyl-L-alanine amidase